MRRIFALILLVVMAASAAEAAGGGARGGKPLPVATADERAAAKQPPALPADPKRDDVKPGPPGEPAPTPPR